MPAAGGYARTETPLLISAPSDTCATTDLYFGGGHTGLLGKNFYYSLGMFIAPNANMTTKTTISAEKSSGNVCAIVDFLIYWKAVHHNDNGAANGQLSQRAFAGLTSAVEQYNGRIGKYIVEYRQDVSSVHGSMKTMKIIHSVDDFQPPKKQNAPNAGRFVG